MKKISNILCFIVISISLLGCSKDDDFDSDKACWTCIQKKVWNEKNGLQSIVTFKYEYCNKSEKDIQKIIDRLTYSGYEGGGNMKSTMSCKKVTD